MNKMRIPPVPAATGYDAVAPVAPAPRTRRPPPPQPRADTGGPGMVSTGRGAVAHKPHNPDNHLGAMPTAAPRGKK